MEVVEFEEYGTQGLCTIGRPVVKDETIKIKDLQRVKLEPGDVLVVRSERPLSMSHQGRIRDRLKEVFPDHEVVIMRSGLELFVVKP